MKESYSLGELHDGWKVSGFATVLNVIRETEHWECLMGLFDSVCANVWMSVYTCAWVYVCVVIQCTGKVEENTCTPIPCAVIILITSNTFYSHKNQGTFSLFIVNASLSGGSSHIFREKRGIISHPLWPVNRSLKKGQGMQFTPRSAAPSSKTCSPIIFINLPVFPADNTGRCITSILMYL